MENTAFTGDDESEKHPHRVEDKENGKAPKEVRNWNKNLKLKKWFEIEKVFQFQFKFNLNANNGFVSVSFYCSFSGGVKSKKSCLQNKHFPTNS